MELKKILRFADDVVLAKTNKHLNDLQRDILEETLQGSKYNKIAERHDCTVKYLGKINYILASKIVQHFFNVSEEALSVFIGAKFNPFIF
jgi:hypothetical protein